MEKVKLDISFKTQGQYIWYFLIFLFAVFGDSYLDMRVSAPGDDDHFNSSGEAIASKCDLV